MRRTRREAPAGGSSGLGNAHNALTGARLAASPFASSRAQYGPFWMCLSAAILCNLDPLRHVLLDSGFGASWMSMYRPHCASHSNWACLSVVGWTVTIGSTYVGFALLIAGVLWVSNVPATVAQLWRQARRRREVAAASSSSQLRTPLAAAAPPPEEP